MNELNSRPKILYIEDTPEALRLVSRVLSQEFVVLEASDPLDGIEIAIEAQPDLILLDINLPNMSGREVAARLKTLIPDTLLIAFSADASTEARERALAAGCVGYLTKPIDIDTFADQLKEFLAGKRERLVDRDRHQRAFEAELVEHLEQKVRELTKTAELNAFLNEQNLKLITDLRRRHHLLEAAARVSRVVTSILDLDELLQVTVDTICEEYDFYYAAIFLLAPSGEWAVLRAGRGKAGAAMLAERHRLAVNGDSMVGTAISQKEARIALDVGEEPHHFKNPHLPETRSEMALPLIVKSEALGALSVQSEQVNAFSDEDITALQTLANQVAIAIDNAQLLHDLQQANQELLRNKTFEAIAQTTGETIHWVGNKAAPIPSSALRVQDDLTHVLAACKTILAEPVEKRQEHSLWIVLREAFESAETQGYDLQKISQELSGMTPQQLQLMGYLESIFEDLTIIEQSARAILDIKEDLIGPVRLQSITELDLDGVLRQTIFEMGLPEGVVKIEIDPELPSVRGDNRQIGQVFNNLIKNAWEALYEFESPQIRVVAYPTADQKFVQVKVVDNGPGIPPEILEKIWVSFFTTKGERGGTGLGLSACMAIINQHEGKISVTSEVGAGTTFTVRLPVIREAR